MVVELDSLPERTMKRIRHVEELGSAGPSRRRQKERLNKTTSFAKDNGIREHADDLLGVGALFGRSIHLITSLDIGSFRFAEGNCLYAL